MKINKEYFIVIFLLLIIISITFYELLSGQKVLASADTLSPLAIKEGISRSLENGSMYPLWIPWIFGGLPSIHSLLNISINYYPHKILTLFIYTLGMPWIWNFLIHNIFGAMGMYKFLKYLNINKFASFIVSASFMIMPYMIVMTVHGHGSQVMTACYIPWIMLYLFKIIDRFNLLNFSLLSLLIGLQLQRGHIQIAYYTWMMIGLYVLINIIYSIYIEKKVLFQIGKKYFLIFSSLISGVLLSFNLYYPVLNYSQYSNRGMNQGGIGIEKATQWSFSLKESLTFYLPSSLGFGGETYRTIGNMPFTDYPNYLGIILLIFAFFGLTKVKIKNIYKIFFILVLVFSFLLSLGENFIGFYNIFYNYLPFFNKFRAPVYILIIFNFSLYVFSAYGIEYIVKSIKKNNKIDLFYYVSLFFVLLITIIYFSSKGFIADDFQYSSEYLSLLNHDILNLVALIFILSISSFFIIYKKIDYKIFYLTVLLLCIYDFTRVAHEIINPNLHIPNNNNKVVKSKEYIDKYLASDDYIKNDKVVNFLLNDNSKYRIFDLSKIYGSERNRWASFNIENVDGYHPAKLSQYDNFISRIEKHTITFKNGEILNCKLLGMANEMYYAILNDDGEIQYIDKENVNYIKNPEVVWSKGLLQLFNVKYLLKPIITREDALYEHNLFTYKTTELSYFYSRVPQLSEINGTLRQFKIFEIKDFMPRLYYVNNIIKVNNSDIFDLILDDSFNPSVTSYITNINQDYFFKNDNPSVEIINWTSNKIKFTTHTNSEQFLVMSEAYFPYGWELSDGSKAYDIYEVNNLVRGFFVPKGKTNFVMKFNPQDVLWGKRLSMLTFILLLVIIISTNLYRKKDV